MSIRPRCSTLRVVAVLPVLARPPDRRPGIVCYDPAGLASVIPYRPVEASAFVREKTSSCDYLLCEDADCAVKPYVLGSSTPAKRARENRIPIVKGETGFDAVITDANGMVLERTDDKTENGEVNVLVADVHLSPRDAPFTQLGGMWFGVLVLIAAVARYGWQVALWWRGR